MKFVHGTFTIILIVFCSTLTCGYVLSPAESSEEDTGVSIQSLKDILDEILEEDNIGQDYNTNKNVANGKCFLCHQLRTYKIEAEASNGVIQCLGVSMKDLEDYFGSREWRRLKRRFRRDIRRCKRRTDNLISYLYCSANVVVHYLADIKTQGTTVRWETKSCIASVLITMVDDLVESNEILQECLQDETTLSPTLSTSKSPNVNTTWSADTSTTTPQTSPTVLPIANTTFDGYTTRKSAEKNATILPIVNTTWYGSSTRSPLEVNTTVLPIENTTWDSSTTTISWKNISTTLLPNVTATAWENNSTVSPVASTTWNDYTTRNSSESNTTLLPIVNTTASDSSTRNPSEVNTTVLPVANTTWESSTTKISWENNTTIVPTSNSTWSNDTNTTSSEYDTTLLPISNTTTVQTVESTAWSNNTTLLPVVDTNSTLNPVHSNETRSSNPTTQEKPELPWWKKAWEDIFPF